MRIIITHNTDQEQAHYGYCTKCWNYLELWAKDKKSTCHHCKTKLHHIHSKYILLLGIILYIALFGYLIYNN